jgi:glutathione peroxidase
MSAVMSLFRKFHLTLPATFLVSYLYQYIQIKLFDMLRMAAFGLITTLFMSIYDFSVPSLDGGKIDFSKYKGKKVLIVNTASQCGFTPQYEELQKLYDTYKDKLVIVGFPANNFGGQEPGTNTEIKEFCKKNYGVTFPMAEKVSVVGDDIHPLFKYLTEEASKKGISHPIEWNFTKFLLDENGETNNRFSKQG